MLQNPEDISKNARQRTGFTSSKIAFHVLSVDIKSWDIQNLLIVSQTFELSLKIKIVIKELNFNLICKKPNLHNVYF
jgi:uncharacterized protein YqfA (UPF0365 family)